MKVVALTILLSIYMVTQIHSQDLHFSNNKFSPLIFNPAQTGLFNNTLRVGGTMRDQFRSFISNPYKSSSIWIDSPIIHGLSERHWIGVGVSGFVDQVGDVGQKMTAGNISAAYHMALDKKYNRILSVGFQYGSTQRKYNAEAAKWGDGEGSLDKNLLQNTITSVSDINVGIIYKQRINKRSTVEMGIALIHANAPSFTISGSSVSNPISRRVNLDTKLNLKLSESFTLVPTIATSFMGDAYNIQIQCFSDIDLHKEKKFSLTPGLGYRYGDAIQIHLGGIYDQWHVGISYDVTLSTAADFNNNRGGLEIGVLKYIDIAKKPKVDPVILCPRL